MEEICECDGDPVHKLSQRRLTADWLAPWESVHGCAVRSPLTGCQVTSRSCNQFSRYSKWLDTYRTTVVHHFTMVTWSVHTSVFHVLCCRHELHISFVVCEHKYSATYSLFVCNCVLTDPLTISVWDLMECMFTCNILVHIFLSNFGVQISQNYYYAVFGNFVMDQLYIFIELFFFFISFLFGRSTCTYYRQIITSSFNSKLHNLSLYGSKLSMFFLIPVRIMNPVQSWPVFSGLQL